MERGSQLLDIMNEVSARLDHAPAFARPSLKRDTIDEMQAFLLLDPLLADLNKQYQDARGSRLQAEKDFGRSDGMTDMTVMMEDSAWCAMQTRYMELRDDRKLMAKANAMVDESRRDEEEKARAQKEREALKIFEQMQMFARMREANQNQASQAGWWLVILWYLSKQPVLFRDHHATYRFNRLAA